MRAAYLLGFRGAGKTTLGRGLARGVGWTFLDLDEEWEKRNGISILNFVERNGEQRFRETESLLLAEVNYLACTERLPQPLVIATGGGIVDMEASRQTLLASPLPKILIEVGEEELWARLSGQAERRKIGGLSDPQALNALLAFRRPFYEKIATYRLKNQDITQSLIELKRLLSGLWQAAP